MVYKYIHKKSKACIKKMVSLVQIYELAEVCAKEVETRPTLWKSQTPHVFIHKQALFTIILME